jgi:hypothetical protein
VAALVRTAPRAGFDVDEGREISDDGKLLAAAASPVMLDRVLR